jgi:hypothetical protein
MDTEGFKEVDAPAFRRRSDENSLAASEFAVGMGNIKDRMQQVLAQHRVTYFGKNITQRFATDFEMAGGRPMRVNAQVFAQGMNNRIEILVTQTDVGQGPATVQRCHFGRIDGPIGKKREGNDAGNGIRAIFRVVAHFGSPGGWWLYVDICRVITTLTNIARLMDNLQLNLLHFCIRNDLYASTPHHLPPA